MSYPPQQSPSGPRPEPGAGQFNQGANPYPAQQAPTNQPMNQGAMNQTPMNQGAVNQAPPNQPMGGYRPPRAGSHGPNWPIRRKPVVMVIPIIAMVLGGIMTALVTTTGLLSGTPLLLLFPMVVTILGLLFVWWIDRWEPEPTVMWIGALAWGAGVATTLAMVLNGLFGAVAGEALGAAVGAPLIEESTKGLFLLLVLYLNKKGRAELNSVTDAIVYGSLVGIGFSYVEDVTYFASAESSDQALVTAIVRSVAGGFSHSVYTTMTALGVWFGLSRGGGWKVGGPLLGWCVAVLLHGLHNGSTLFGIGGYVIQLIFVSLTSFVFVVVAAIVSSKREGRTLNRQLPSMVHAGWVTGEEATWLSQVKSRRARLKSTPNAMEKTRLATIADAATELAFLRGRLDQMADRGQVLRPELLREHDDLVALLGANRNVIGAQLPQQYPAMAPVQGQVYSAQPPLYQ